MAAQCLEWAQRCGWHVRSWPGKEQDTCGRMGPPHNFADTCDIILVYWSNHAHHFLKRCGFRFSVDEINRMPCMRLRQVILVCLCSAALLTRGDRGARKFHAMPKARDPRHCCARIWACPFFLRDPQNGGVFLYFPFKPTERGFPFKHEPRRVAIASLLWKRRWWAKATCRPRPRANSVKRQTAWLDAMGAWGKCGEATSTLCISFRKHSKGSCF